MPFKDDRRSFTAASWVATTVCGGLLCAVILAVRHQPSDRPAVPLELIVGARPRAEAKPQPRGPEPLIRVNLTGAAQTQFRISVRGPYAIRSLDSAKSLGQGEKLANALVSAPTGGLKVGRDILDQSSIEIRPTKADLISVNDHAYHGVIRIYRTPQGKLTAVNVLPLEQYVSCVLDAEMPAKFPSAAREAQAIVARTYALWQMQQANPAANYDVFATVRSQKYLGAEYSDKQGRRLAGESASSRQAVAATRGQVCRVRNRLFCTYYSAVCGGATTPGSELFTDADAALRSVPCDWCRESNKYRWSLELKATELLSAVRKQRGAKNLTVVKSIRQRKGPAAGVISQWDISDGERIVTVTGIQLRESVPGGKLLSPHFEMTMASGKITVTGRGYGHGAGLCQWGARGLANAGKSAKDIVQYYYTGSTVAADGY